MGFAKISAFLKIDGKFTYSFQDYTVQFDSLADENSGRTDDGVMKIKYIWSAIRKVNIKLPPMTQADISKILSQVQGQEYSLTYLDPIKGIYTSKFYTSASSADLYNGVLYDGLWRGAAFNAIELAGER